MSVKNIVLYIVAGLIIFAVGGGAGVLYQQQKGEEINFLFKTLNSKIISSIMADGYVANIEGKNISLDLNGESLIVKIRDDAKVMFFDDKGVQKEIKFEDIKKGDFINVNIRLFSANQFEGYMILMRSPLK